MHVGGLLDRIYLPVPMEISFDWVGEEGGPYYQEPDIDVYNRHNAVILYRYAGRQP